MIKSSQVTGISEPQGFMCLPRPCCDTWRRQLVDLGDASRATSHENVCLAAPAPSAAARRTITGVGQLRFPNSSANLPRAVSITPAHAPCVDTSHSTWDGREW